MGVAKLKNFYQSVAEHKDVCKLVALLTSSVNSLRKPASDVLKLFLPFKVIWAEDRQAKVKVGRRGLLIDTGYFRDVAVVSVLPSCGSYNSYNS